MAEQQEPTEEGLDVTVEDIQADDIEPTVEDKLAAANDRILRLQAEVQNQITRGARQMQEERQYAALPLARDLLPVLDNIDRAIDAAEKEGPAGGSTGGLLEGIKLVRQQLLTAITQHKCEAISAAGEPFNPDFHEAILQQPSDEVPAGSVLQDVQTGYKMHDRVVRASQVIVSSGPAAGDA
ncbi:heat shock protein GrpE [Posidoniimonas polymericola]|uniref:Protein GrpE n=1 Tax=Posidoniimonas polymericola TaxID=2528002 RepID=A0A5C5YPN1_9BACT|nr:nucleotide exchange factor GrpE [Posidoniimonas polymericola]TWT76911.1 heat shock protein GrpE [Posidoniimonas polymericola]